MTEEHRKRPAVLVAAGLFVFLAVVLSVRLIGKDRAATDRKHDSGRDLQNSERSDSDEARHSTKGDSSGQGDPRPSGRGDSDPIVKKAASDRDYEVELARKIVELKRAQGSRVAYEFLTSLAWDKDLPGLHSYFAIRLIPYAVSGEPDLVAAATAEFSKRIVDGPTTHQMMAMLAALSGSGYQLAYAGSGENVEVALLPSRLEAAQLDGNPYAQVTNAYNWDLPDQAECKNCLTLALRNGLRSEDYSEKMAALVAASVRPSQEIEGDLLGILASANQSRPLRVEAIEALKTLGTRTAIDGIVSAARQDASADVRITALRAVVDSPIDRKALADFLADRVLAEENVEVATAGVDAVLEVAKKSDLRETGAAIQRIFQGFALRDESKLVSFLASLGESLDARFLDLVRNGSALVHSEHNASKVKLALSRLENPDRYRGILRETTDVKQRLEAIQTEANTPGIPKERWQKLNAEEILMIRKLEQLQDEYSRPVE